MKPLKANKTFYLIAGPCVIESQGAALKIARYLKDNFSRLPVKLVFKASFDKANRTSIDSYRGPGLEEGCAILKKIKAETNLTILTDVHCCQQIKKVSAAADIIQIPAFLCRQTDLIMAAAKTSKIINLKKGQFVSPENIGYAIKKIEATKNKNILITERGFCFGYNDLVVDFRSFLIMKKHGYPVIFDATHSLQKPSAKAGISGGDSCYVEPLSLAAVAAGVDGLFLEIHPCPKKALSDKFTIYPMANLKNLIKKALQLRKLL